MGINDYLRAAMPANAWAEFVAKLAADMAAQGREMRALAAGTPRHILYTDLAVAEAASPKATPVVDSQYRHELYAASRRHARRIAGKGIANE